MGVADRAVGLKIGRQSRIGQQFRGRLIVGIEYRTWAVAGRDQCGAAPHDFPAAHATLGLIEARDNLEEKVDERTRDLRRMVNAMSGREVRMAELKKELKDLKGTP